MNSRHPGRYDDRTAQDIVADEIRWQKWLAMPDVEQERQVELALQDYPSLLLSLTPLQRYRRSRRIALGHCLSWRQLYRDEGLEFFKEMLRERQMRLVEIRFREPRT